ncbi:hypothetical protein OUHCRE13_46550 [Enterobacter roggenkampii]
MEDVRYAARYAPTEEQPKVRRTPPTAPRHAPAHVSSGTVGTTFGNTSSSGSRSPGFGAGQL